MAAKDFLKKLLDENKKLAGGLKNVNKQTKKVSKSSNKRNKTSKDSIKLDENQAKHLKFLSSLFTAFQKKLIKAALSEEQLISTGVQLNALHKKEEMVLSKLSQKRKLLAAIDKKRADSLKVLRQRVAKNVAAQERLLQVEKKRRKSLNDLVTQSKIAGKTLKGNTEIIRLYQKALKRGGVAEKKFRHEMKRLKVQTDANKMSFLQYIMARKGLTKAGVLGVRNTRNSSSAFSVLRSKLLLASFAVMLVQKSILTLVKAFAEQEKAERKVHQAMFTTGFRAHIASNEIVRYAAELQRLTGVGDEVILSSSSMLLSFTRIDEAFKETQLLALDMSAAMGQDLKSSTIQLGKALQDPIKGLTSLSRIGVTFTAKQKKQIQELLYLNKTYEAQKIILAELQKEFGGMAEAIGALTEGELAKLNASFGDLTERIGEVLAPTLVNVSKNLTSFIDSADSDSLREFVETVTALVAALLTVKVMTMAAVNIFKKYKALQLLIKAGTWQLQAGLMALQGVILLVTGRMFKSTMQGKKQERIFFDLNNTTEDLVKSMKALAKMKGLEAVEGQMETLDKQIDEVKAKMRLLVKSADKIDPDWKQKARDAREYNDQLIVQDGTMSKMESKWESQLALWEILSKKLDNFIGKQDRLIETQEKMKKAFGEGLSPETIAALMKLEDITTKIIQKKNLEMLSKGFQSIDKFGKVGTKSINKFGLGLSLIQNEAGDTVVVLENLVDASGNIITTWEEQNRLIQLNEASLKAFNMSWGELKASGQHKQIEILVDAQINAANAVSAAEFYTKKFMEQSHIRRQADRAEIKQRRDDILKMYDFSLIKEKEAAEHKKVINKETNRLLLANTAETMGAYLQLVMDVYNQAAEHMLQAISAERQRLDEQLAAQNALLDARKDEAAYVLASARMRLRMDADISKQKKANELAQEAQRKRLFVKEKKIQRVMAYMNTANAIINALTITPATLGYVMAGVAAAIGAYQIEQINSQQYKYGGLVGGNLHSQGGTMIEAEKGEYVMRREAVQRMGVRSLNAINSGVIDRDISNSTTNNNSNTILNISFEGNLLTDEFLEDEAIPKIKEMLRQGNDLGI